MSMVTAALSGLAPPAGASKPTNDSTFSGYASFTAYGGSTIRRGANVTAYLMNGDSAYCVDPGLLNGEVYPVSDALIARIEESLKLSIGYGFSYKRATFLGKPLDVGNPALYESAFVATQFLIWEFCMGMRPNLDFKDDDYTYNSLAGMGKPGVAYAYRQLLSYIREHLRGDAAFTPDNFYPTAREAVEKAVLVDTKSACEAKIAGVTSDLAVNAYIGNYIKMRAMYGKVDEFTSYGDDEFEQNVLYSMAMDGKPFKVDEGSNKALWSVSGLGSGTLRFSFNPFAFTEKGGPLLVRIARAAEDSLIVTGDIKWFQAYNEGKVQRRIQFEPTSEKKWSELYAAFKSNYDAIIDDPPQEEDPPQDIDPPLIVDEPPKPEFPSFLMQGEKDDAEPGFDGSIHTPRGNATLSAGFSVKVKTSSGETNGTPYAPHDGMYAQYTFAPWNDVSQAEATSMQSTDTPYGPFASYYMWTFRAAITVNEIPPEGYLPEPPPGGGERQYTLEYIIEASRSVSTDEEGNVIFSDWTYMYTSRPSESPKSGPQAAVHTNSLAAAPVFVNTVKKGSFQLVKTYDEDLDPWTVTGGLKKYMPNSEWTLRLVDAGTDGNRFSFGGSENHPYVNVIPIGPSDPAYSAWGNSYRVTVNASGTPADAKNPLRTSNDGQLYLYGLPYGYYKLEEQRCPANEGYVLETVYFEINENGVNTNGRPPSQEVNDEVIENEILVVKKNSETGKTVPYGGAAFRVRYLGYNHTDPATGVYGPVSNASSGECITNGSGIDDGYQYVFYTDIAGRIKLNYPLEYGLWRLEEITAPYGYYIGDYSTGNGVPAEGSMTYGDTVAIFTPSGDRVDYTKDDGIIYNYYQFEVSEQNKGQIVVQTVDMANNPVKGKIEVRKVGEKLAGFNVTDSEFGPVYTPVYEMQPLEGAVFEIVSAQDTKLRDGYDEPRLYDRDGERVTPELISFPHALWPDADSTKYALLPGGTQAYIVTGRDPSEDDTISARLLTSPQKGVEYKLSYDIAVPSDADGVTLTSKYDISLGLEYAAGGWNYSYVEMTRRTEGSDYVSAIPPLPPTVSHLGEDYKIGAPGAITAPDSSSIDILGVSDEYIDENGETLEPVQIIYYGDIAPSGDPGAVPEPPEEYAGIEPSIISVRREDGDGGAVFDGEVYSLSTDDGELWYVLHEGSGTGEWISPQSIVRVESGKQWRLAFDIAPPEGFSVTPENFEFGYIAADDATGARFAMLTRVIGSPEVSDGLRWAYCDGYMRSYLRRTETYRFDLNESNASSGGFTVTWGEFVFTNLADHAVGSALASVYNPSGNAHELSDGVGVRPVLSEDGKTLTMTVSQPERQAWYELEDGSELSIIYLGGYTKTTVTVPHGIPKMPVIKYGVTPVSYADKLDADNLAQTSDMGGGCYIKAAYDQLEGKYTIEIVSNSTPGSLGFTTEFYTGHTSRSDVIYDEQLGAYRGMLSVVATGATLVYKSGTLVQRLDPTDADGVAYSGLLPLGTYYVREVSAGKGYVVSGESYRVDLEYANQYVPLVWSGASVDNEALNVTIDIAKMFQNEALDGYEYRSGATFGIYNKNTVTAGSGTVSAYATTDIAQPLSLIGIVEIGGDGRALTTLKLPFGHDYYAVELSTQDGYAKSGTRHLFRCDESAFSDGLKFSYRHDGISGEINQTGLFEATLTVETLYQIPARTLEASGAALVSQTEYLDKTVTVIKVLGQEGAHVVFDNGAAVTVSAYSDGYTAVFAPPTEEGCQFESDIGGIAGPLSRELLEDGSSKFTYSPTVAFTACSVSIVAPYRPPSTVMTTADGIRINIAYDSGSAARTAVLTYPGSAQNIEESVDMDALLSEGIYEYEYVPTLGADAEGEPITGEPIQFNIDAGGFSISTAGIACRVPEGIQPDGMAVSYETQGSGRVTTTLSQRNREFAISSEGSSTRVSVALPHDNSYARVYTDAGAVTGAYADGGPAAISDVYTVDPGGALTLSVADGAAYFVALDKNGALRFSAEGVITGPAPPPPTAASADADGETYYDSARLRADAEVTFSRSLTLARSSGKVSEIEVKINSRAENHMTPAQESGESQGRADGIANDLITVDFIKRDLAGAPLQGARITVYDTTGAAVFEGMTAADGIARWTGALPGEYTFRETRAPDGYLLDSTLRAFTADADGTICGDLTLYNAPAPPIQPNVPAPQKPYMRIRKIDADDGGPLQGAVIAVVSEQTGKQIFSGTTDASGYVTFLRPDPGQYIFREVEAPEGYMLNTDEFTFIILPDGRTEGALSITDEKIPEPEEPEMPEEPEEPGTPELPGDTPIDVPDEDIPRTDFPPPPPSETPPRTGDGDPYAYLALAAASASSMAALLIRRHRRRRRA
ncbi:MAG: hypothetical protein LBC21_00430 [Oscillospiraceae bacterium]|jgi:hypothetical protein|nr:hypothetical protein [Oscillospiraceae bacterium]